MHFIQSILRNSHLITPFLVRPNFYSSKSFQAIVQNCLTTLDLDLSKKQILISKIKNKIYTEAQKNGPISQDLIIQLKTMESEYSELFDKAVKIRGSISNYDYFKQNP